jgi:hypothetical protein
MSDEKTTCTVSGEGYSLLHVKRIASDKATLLFPIPGGMVMNCFLLLLNNLYDERATPSYTSLGS